MFKTLFIFFYGGYTFISLQGTPPCNDSLLLKKYFVLKTDTVVKEEKKLDESLELESKIKDILQSIHIREKNNAGTAEDATNLVKSYYNLLLMYDTEKKSSEKIKALDSCVAICSRYDLINAYYLHGLYTRAEYFYNVGDYLQCIRYTRKCETIAAEYITRVKKDTNDIGVKYLLSSSVIHVNALFQLKEYKLAKTLLIGKIDSCKKYNTKNYLGSIYEQLADVQKENFSTRLSYLKKAFKFERLYGSVANCKVYLNNIGNAYIETGNDFKNAFRYYKKALNYTNVNQQNNKSDDSIEAVNILSNIGSLYSRKNLFDSAQYYFQLALEQIKPGINETVLLDIPIDKFTDETKIGYLFGLLMNKAEAYRNQYAITRELNSISKAVNVYKIMDKLLERIKSKQSEIESKLFWRGRFHRLYEQGIEACYQYNNIEDAFYFFERSRAVLLNDQLKEQHWLKEEDIIKRTSLKEEILQLNTVFSNTDASSPKHEELEKEIFKKNNDLDRLEQLIKDHNPLYYQNFLDTSNLTLTGVRANILKEHNALVEMFDGDSAVYSMVITATNSYVNKIDKASFDSSVWLYRHYLSNPDLLNEQYNSFVQVSRYLYQLIFKKMLLPAGRIIISPDASSFPFESLITNINSSNPVYFLTDYAISYTYSARYLLINFASDSKKFTKNFIGFAPVSYATNLGLPSLSGSDVSLTQIANDIPGAYNLFAINATRNNFRKQFSDYKIIQLYTHASDSSERKEPVIYFADSALYLSELIPQRKPLTQLIVLSACETAKGTLYAGEGVFSFNRAFAALGIPSAVSNLWSIDNVGTYKLTELFSKYFSQGLPLDIELQKAKLEYISSAQGENHLPYYWAAPILVGKTDAIVLDKPFPWEYYLFAGIGAVAIILYGLRRQIRKRKSITQAQDTIQTVA